VVIKQCICIVFINNCVHVLGDHNILPEMIEAFDAMLSAFAMQSRAGKEAVEKAGGIELIRLSVVVKCFINETKDFSHKQGDSCDIPVLCLEQNCTVAWARMYSMGQKNGLFLRVDNFLTVNGRKACESFQILSRKV